MISLDIGAEQNPVHPKNNPEDAQQKELANVVKLIKEYLKSTTDEERSKVAMELDKINVIPPLTTISSAIKGTITYPKFAPIKRYTRKIKVNDVEVSYELSLPADYSPQKESPLVISLHGAGGDGVNGLHIWRIPPEDQESDKEAYIKRLKDAGQTPPPKDKLVIASPIGTNQYIIAAPTAIGSSDLILPLLEDVISQCNVDTNRVYLSGFSAGGGFTFLGIMAQPDYFAGAVLMSSVNTNQDFLGNLLNLPLYIIHGEKDEGLIEPIRAIYQILKDLKYDVTYREIKGLGHQMPPSSSDEKTKLLTWLNYRTRNSFPKRIVYKPLDRTMPIRRIYWLEIPGSSANIEAEVSDNKINIKSEGLKKVTILLSPNMVDFNKEIVVSINEREVFKGKVNQSLKFLLDDYLKHKDSKRLFTAKIDLDLSDSKNK